MPLRVIEVDPADTYYSLRHRLLWDDRQRAVLFLPDHTPPLSAIDLVLLRRLAARERLSIGLVTGDKDLARQARALGLPAFSSLTLAEHFRPGWWRTARRKYPIGFAPGQRVRPPAKVVIPASTSMYALRLLVFLLAAILVLGIAALIAAYSAPVATLRIRPQHPPVQLIADFTAGPSTSEAGGRIVPARRIAFDQAWEATRTVTGDAAEGSLRTIAQAQASLAAAAPDLLAARLEPGERLLPSSIQIATTDEMFDPLTGTATLNVQLAGLAAREEDLRPLVLQQLSERLPAHYAPDPASLRLQFGPGASTSANAFQVTATALGRVDIDRVALARLLRGQRITDAAGYLADTYQLTESLFIDMQPSWWWGLSRGRLPYRADRIHIELLP